MCLWHLTTSRPLIAVYMYMCMDCVSRTPFGQNRSTVVEFKCVTSKCLVQFLYMCVGCFLLWICFVLSYKGENCLQVKWEVHNSSAFFLFLKVTPFGKLVWLTRLTWKSLFSMCQVKMCLCELWLGNQWLCHVAGCELVTCWEVLLLLLIGRRVLLALTAVLLLCLVPNQREAGPDTWAQGHLRKWQFKAQRLTWDKVPKCQILIF